MNCLLDNYPERREDEDDHDGSAVIIIFIPPDGALLARSVASRQPIPGAQPSHKCTGEGGLV